MREIKFRAKTSDLDKTKSRWVEGDLLAPDLIRDTRIGYLMHTTNMSVEGKLECSAFRVKPETVGQFTGFTDNNGKEIFEGDILYTKYEDKCEEKGYYEVYNEVAFQFGVYGFIGEITGKLLPFSEYPTDETIVIGNIHDNPELLLKSK